MTKPAEFIVFGNHGEIRVNLADGKVLSTRAELLAAAAEHGDDESPEAYTDIIGFDLSREFPIEPGDRVDILDLTFTTADGRIFKSIKIPPFLVR